MMKVILKLDYADDKTKQKAMKKVSGLSGVESIALDSKEKKLTITGVIDPIAVVAKLRKICNASIVWLGPAKDEPKKADDKKKEEPAAQWPKTYQVYYPGLYYYHPQPTAAVGKKV